ncbi:Mov34/MPN/PAD-1 family protein [Limnoglobus roseus]|uniref:Mov34/MPN/PAD-1 family protein n=1 Tax=Limnoglobus roseus TaxID=2598579 RepID=UPI0011EAA393|nr:Mov34/MPN/PAD-1 family protein [Limnoglobus roseus]
MTDEVSRTLFGEYAAHRQTDRGTEETGWVLLGLRETNTATVLATLPAGANRDAGQEHVRFNTEAQALASRIVRQDDRRLTLLGVVHTHPGTLRHPSGGDLRGDREWVKRLRGRQGIFAIGTVDDETHEATVGEHPRPHVQKLKDLRFDWYSLTHGEASYQNLPVELTIGPDVAQLLRGVWPIIEAHAGRLDRLARQQANVRFAVTTDDEQPGLAVSVPLAEPGQSIRLLVHEKSVRFFYAAGGEVFQADLPAGAEPDQGVYLLLAELAARG